MGYAKQGFKDGDVLNASQLINIEQGIQDNETEMAKKAELVIFAMHATGGGSGLYALEFEGGSTFSDVQKAILAKKDVFVQINGNSVFMDGHVIRLLYSGIASNGAFEFTYSVTDGMNITVMSVTLSENYSQLLSTSPITSIDDGTEVKY